MTVSGLEEASPSSLLADAFWNSDGIGVSGPFMSSSACVATASTNSLSLPAESLWPAGVGALLEHRVEGREDTLLWWVAGFTSTDWPLSEGAVGGGAVTGLIGSPKSSSSRAIGIAGAFSWCRVGFAVSSVLVFAGGWPGGPLAGVGDVGFPGASVEPGEDAFAFAGFGTLVAGPAPGSEPAEAIL